MIRASQSRWVVATAVMALAVGGLALASPASAGGKSNKPAVVTVEAVPTDQSVTVTYTINRANKAIASQTCTLDGASTPCDTSPNSATGKPVKTTYSVTINGLDNGDHTFAVSFLLADGNGGSNSDTFTINYTPPNQAPVAVDDEVTTSEDTPVTFNVLTNDSDADGDSLMMSQVDLASAHGSVPLESVFATGDVTWVPDADFSGTDSFSYNVWDGQDFDTGTVNITVTPVNDPPDARDDTATTLEDTAVTLDVLANDSDVEGDPFEIDTFFFDPTYTGGSVGRTDDGQFIFTPASDFSGLISFTYTIRSPDGLEDTATVTVTVLDDPYPAARVDCEGEPLPGTFTLGDPGSLPPRALWGCTIPRNGDEWDLKVLVVGLDCAHDGGSPEITAVPDGNLISCLTFV